MQGRVSKPAPTKSQVNHRRDKRANAVRPYFFCAARRASAWSSQPRFNSDSGTLLR
jgi:hypothetical protein